MSWAADVRTILRHLRRGPSTGAADSPFRRHVMLQVRRARASSPAQREDRARSQCRSALQETDPERIAAIRSQAKNYALLVQSVTVQKVRATKLAPARISRLPASHAHRRVTFSRR